MAGEPTPTAKRVQTAVFGAFTALAAGFIALSTWGIIEQVFSLSAAPVVSAVHTDPVCEQGLRALAKALDRGVVASAGASTEADARSRLRAALVPEWDDQARVAAECGRAPHGSEAWAALQRLRMAEEWAAARRVVDVGPVRRDVAAYLP